MARKPPPRPPAGQRMPGSGRRRGPNRISVEARDLVAQLVTDPAYQAQLRRKFENGIVDPRIEGLIWQFHLGKPREHVEVVASLTSARIEAEREALRALDVHQLEALVSESEALVERAIAAAQRKAAQALSGEVVAVPGDDPVTLPPTQSERLWTVEAGRGVFAPARLRAAIGCILWSRLPNSGDPGASLDAVAGQIDVTNAGAADPRTAARTRASPILVHA